MFTAECDQCGARNKLPASAEDEGINSGSLVACSSCGAEVCVRLATEPAPPVSELPNVADDSGEDELTRVMEANHLPDAHGSPVQVAVEEQDPPTARRAGAAAASDESDGVPLVDLNDLLETAPESIPPLSQSDLVDEPESLRERHLPVPPAREVHAESSQSLEELSPVSFGTPTLATLVRKATPPPAPHRPHATHDDPPVAHDVLVPPAGPVDELFDARVLPLLRPPSETEAPVASVSRPPEPRKEPPKNNGMLGFALLVAGVAFVAGLTLNNSREKDATAPALPAALPAAQPLGEAPAVAPLPEPAAQAPSPAALTPNPELPPSETAAAASPPPLLAAPERDPNKPAMVAAPKADAPPRKVDVAPRAEAPASAPVAEAPRSTVAPVRSATVATDAPPPEVAFDSMAAANALSAAAQRASSCKKPTDPSGVAVVTITFSPSGRVTSATISGPPFAGTETGSCIASTLRGVKVPAYSGDFMTVKKTIEVR